jgi:peptidoglycan/LPS O-acetylase OafA/YrhL
MSNPPGQAPSYLRRPHGAASVHLDALRGIAAVGVCLSHLRDFLFQDYPKLPYHGPWVSAAYLATGLGHQWVIAFFVLSGYLVGGGVLRSIVLDRWSWRSYLLNRMTRLYTVLIPALVLGGILDITGIHLFGVANIYGGQTGAHELVFSVRNHLSIPILIGNYAFLQGIYVPTFGSNGPLWSLANEFWYYIAFPFLAVALLRPRPIPLRLVNAVLLIAVVAFMRPTIALLGIVWLMGVAIHYLPHLPAENVLIRRLLMVAALAACCATLVWCKQTHNPIADFVLGAVMTALIYVVLSCSRTPMPKVYNRTAHVLSRSSYTLYLVHLPLLVFIVAWMARARQIPNAQSALEACAIFVVLMIYAQVVWFLFEKRTDAIRARVKPWVMGSAALSGKSESGETAAQV